MDFFAWDYNNAFPVMMQSIPGFTEVAEVDVYGRRTASACFNNPDYRGHLTGKSSRTCPNTPRKSTALCGVVNAWARSTI